MHSAADGPAPLLRGHEEAEEVFVLTYTARLEVFERFGLADARAMQAAVTIVADAQMVPADPYLVRYAGVSYTDARAVCSGRAFHPKLVVVAHPDHATVAIGSGNLTLAGWHGNDEIWTVLRADADGGPTTIHQVASFLRILADGPVDIGTAAAARAVRCADLLEGLPCVDPGPTVVHSLEQRIIDQLPLARADEMDVYAPFHDHALEALTKLDARFSPDRLTVWVRPDTVVNGRLLERFVEQPGRAVRWADGTRYRHGKFVEWTSGGERWALTGSPNLSAPALLSVAGAGGNVELGLVGPARTTLVPPEMQVSTDAPKVSDLVFRTDANRESGSGIVLLSATIDETGTALQAASPLTAGCRLEAHDRDAGWHVVDDAILELVGDTSRFWFALPAGTPLRVVAADGKPSNTVFVLDPARAALRPRRRVGRSDGDVSALIENGRLQDLLHDIEALRELLHDEPVVVTASIPSDASGTCDEVPASRVRASARLADYLRQCERALDPRTVRWMLGLPQLQGVATESEQTAVVVGDEFGDDEIEAVAEHGPSVREDTGLTDAELKERMRALSRSQRRQVKSFCESAVGRAHDWPLGARAMVGRMVLHGIKARLWDADQIGTLALDAVEALMAPGDAVVDEELAQRASVVGCLLLTLRDRVANVTIEDPETLNFRRALSAGRAVLSEIQDERLDELCLIASPDAWLLDDALEEIAGWASPPTGAERAISGLAQWEVEAVDADGIVKLVEPVPVGALEWHLLLALGLFDQVGPIGAVATTDPGRPARAVWRSPDVVVERTLPSGVFGARYRLPGGQTPRGYATGSGPRDQVRNRLPKAVDRWDFRSTPGETSRELLDSVAWPAQPPE